MSLLYHYMAEILIYCVSFDIRTETNNGIYCFIINFKVAEIAPPTH